MTQSPECFQLAIVAYWRLEADNTCSASNSHSWTWRPICLRSYLTFDPFNHPLLLTEFHILSNTTLLRIFLYSSKAMPNTLIKNLLEHYNSIRNSHSKIAKKADSNRKNSIESFTLRIFYQKCMHVCLI